MVSHWSACSRWCCSDGTSRLEKRGSVGDSSDMHKGLQEVRITSCCSCCPPAFCHQIKLKSLTTVRLSNVQYFQALLQWMKLLSDESRSTAEREEAMKCVENLVNSSPNTFRAMWKDVEAGFRTHVCWPRPVALTTVYNAYWKRCREL